MLRKLNLKLYKADVRLSRLSKDKAYVPRPSASRPRPESLALRSKFITLLAGAVIFKLLNYAVSGKESTVFYA